MAFKRIMIFGLPGSGKSTFSVHLARQLNLPLYHLDKHFFVENWIEREKEEFLSLQQEIVNKNRWIIDGNAISSLEMRYARADLILYFRFPRPLCFGRLVQRRFFKDLSVQDRAKGCKERLRLSLIRYMWKFDHLTQPVLHKLREDYPKTPFYQIQTSRDLENVLSLF